MNNTNGGLLQKNLSRVFQNSRVADIAELFLLLLLGAIAVTLHSRLRIPLHIPGRQGLIFMAIIVAGRSFSKFSFAGSVSCLGASALLFFNVLGYHDPYMPLTYLALGIIIDLISGITSTFSKNIFVLSIAAGLSWACIPLLRMLFSFVTGYFYDSLAAGLIYPLSTHFAAGYLGGLTALGAVSLKRKKTN